MTAGGAAPATADRDRAASRAVVLGLAVGVPLSAFFLWLAVRNADLDEVGRALGDADFGLVAAGACAVCAVYVLQAARWRLVADVARPGALRFLEMVVEGVACNNVLPGRLGDLLRARWLGVDASIPGGRALSTVVLDRSFDVATLLVLLLGTAPFVGDAGWLRRIAAATLVIAVAIVLALAFARVYTGRRHRERRRHRNLLRRFARDTLEGLAAPIGRRRLLRASLLSIAAWSAWAGGAWLVARAVGIDLTAAECLFVAAVVNLGVALPSSPGFVGTYQWLGVASLSLLDVAAEPALAFSILLQAAWLVPTTLAGGTMLLGRGVRRLRRHARTVSEDARAASRTSPGG
jgi:uncharacterized protein (TIRG00374 family)